MSQTNVTSPSTKGKNESRNCMAMFIGHCRAGKVDVINEFVNDNLNFIDINSDDPITKNGWTALMRAADSGKVEAVEYLLKQFSGIIDIDLCHKETGNSALMFAASKNHLSVVKALISNGADVFIKNKNGEMAIKLANAKGATNNMQVINELETAMKEREDMPRYKLLKAIKSSDIKNLQDLLKDPLHDITQTFEEAILSAKQLNCRDISSQIELLLKAAYFDTIMASNYRYLATPSKQSENLKMKLHTQIQRIETQETLRERIFEIVLSTPTTDQDIINYCFSLMQLLDETLVTLKDANDRSTFCTSLWTIITDEKQLLIEWLYERCSSDILMAFSTKLLHIFMHYYYLESNQSNSHETNASVIKTLTMQRILSYLERSHQVKDHYSLLFWLRMLHGQPSLEEHCGVTSTQIMKYIYEIATNLSPSKSPLNTPNIASSLPSASHEIVENWISKFELPIELIDSSFSSQTLGSGGFGHVRSSRLKALSSKVGRLDNTNKKELLLELRIAIKQFGGNVTRADMLKEASLLLLTAGNAHIVHCYGFFEEQTPSGGRVFSLVLEHAPYGSLYDVLLRQAETTSTTYNNKIVASMIPLSLKVHWIQQMLQGLSHLHSFDIKHRDFKPNNVLVFEKLQLKITDLGFSRNTQQFTNQQSSTFGGTDGFIAPEIRFSQPSSTTSDMWSFGISLLFLFHTDLLQLDTTAMLSKIVESVLRGSVENVLSQCFPDCGLKFSALSLETSSNNTKKEDGLTKYEEIIQSWICSLLKRCFQYDNTDTTSYGRISSQVALQELNVMLSTMVSEEKAAVVNVNDILVNELQKSIPTIEKLLLSE